MAFRRDHHVVIGAALGALDANLLQEAGCLFAGGTALALRYGEYRESVDIDFVVADATDYRELRELCRGHGLAALTIPGQRVMTADALMMDQYGIRSRLLVTGVPVKFEIVREARIPLDPPGAGDEVLGLATATIVDAVAMKLLANSDRWTDPRVYSRDVIDIAMVRPSLPVLRAAMAKASGAYGSGVRRDARSALHLLLRDSDRLESCRVALRMEQPRALIVQRLRDLAHVMDRADDSS